MCLVLRSVKIQVVKGLVLSNGIKDMNIRKDTIIYNSLKRTIS